MGTCLRCNATKNITGRHLCGNCYRISTNDGTLENYPRKGRKPAALPRRLPRQYLLDQRITQCFRNIYQRCNYPKDKRYSCYGGAGIKCEITLAEVAYLWVRDNASAMK